MSKKVLLFDDLVGRTIVIKEKVEEDSAGTMFARSAGGLARSLDDILGDPPAAMRVRDQLGLNNVSPVAALSVLRDSRDCPHAIPEALKGVNSIGVAPFLEAFSARIEQDNPCFRVKVGGKIRDHIFIPDPDDPSDCPESGRGHLSVDVLHEIFETNEQLRTCKPGRTEFFHWDIEICKYVVRKRYDIDECSKGQHEHFPNDPFPSVPDAAFPASALDPNDPRSIWCRCLDHKLVAMGKDIKVERVYRQICHDPAAAGDEDFHLLDPSDPRNASYYEQSHDACIDIMFAGYPPLAGLSSGQVEYCLGRCAKPDIVNTGA